MSVNIISLEDINVEKDGRKDPTSFLPEEEMCYEIKKKKKKKKKQQQDPFKDIEENMIHEPDITALDPDIGSMMDPEVTIKVEDIEVDLDVNDFYDNGEVKDEELDIKQEDQSKDSVLLTFQSIVSDNLISDKLLYGEKVPIQTEESFFCQVCQLVFKNEKTLDIHQKRSHQRFRKYFEHKCENCNMSYEHKNSLDAHVRRKHGPDAVVDDKERTCDICSLVFKGMSRLRMHMQRKHNTNESTFEYKCRYCGLMYEKQCSLLVHIRRKHTNKKKTKPNQWFKCPFCAKMYNQRETYSRHVQRSHRVRDDDKKAKMAEEEFKNTYLNTRTGELSCNQCPLAFSTVSYLKWHMRRKHNAMISDFVLKCSICNLSYARAESLKRHVRRKHDKGTFCYDCNQQFDTREAYLGHSHSKNVRECTICGLIFANQGGLAKHLRCTHKMETPITVFCSICNAGFHHKRQLKPHINRVHLNVSFSCETCSKTFKTRETYRRHILFKHPSANIPDSNIHKCESCPETFIDEFELCSHYNTVHRENLVDIKKEEDIKGVYKCTKCTSEFETWETLKAHFEQSHHMTENVQCQICGDMMTRGELIKHIKLHDEVEMQCRFCEFKSANRVSMTQHMLRHKNADTLQCDHPNCKYKTFYEDAMTKHKKKHQEIGVKLQCASCPFQTMNKYILKYHEEAHVTGKKRYQCDKCDYATTLPANLVQHKYKHATEKRFKCEVCPFASKYNTSLRFHVKKKHCDLPTLKQVKVKSSTE